MFDVDSACKNLIALLKFSMFVSFVSALASVIGAMDGALWAIVGVFVSITFMGLYIVTAMCSITILSYIQDDYNAKLKAKSEASTAASK